MLQFSLRIFFFFLAIVSVAFSDEWNRVYLISIPRSGNHWVRFLIEETTHIATSSLYRDRNFPHLPNQFPWGGYSTDHGYEGHCRYPTNQDPIILKSHYPHHPKELPGEPIATICLIRHPIDAFWSFHIFKLRENITLSTAKNIDDQELNEFIASWKKFYTFWEKQPGVLFVRYEDLLENAEEKLRLILQTAGFLFDEADLERAVNRYPPQGGILKHMNHYKDHQLEAIKNELMELLIRYDYAL